MKPEALNSRYNFYFFNRRTAVAGNQNSTSDMDQFSTFLQEAVQRIRTEEDPFVLNQYKKLFKKNVPFSLRTYVAAYLAKTAAESAKKSSGFTNKKNRTKDKVQNKSGDVRKKEPKHQAETADSDKKAAPRRAEIDEALASTIFISVGRNRRVFPRDLVGLISQTAGIDRDRIGEIRVLDNYSFVQLFSEDAETVIEKLNGLEYRGRNLSVSYSRKKDDEAADKPAEKQNFSSFSDAEADSDDKEELMSENETFADDIEAESDNDAFDSDSDDSEENSSNM
jgi:hypothetical protein